MFVNNLAIFIFIAKEIMHAFDPVGQGNTFWFYKAY